jgi:lysyl-tRNA synthetase class 2
MSERLKSYLRGMALTIAIPVTVSIATGWLYWLRGPVSTWPGPKVSDALPLDELPGHDAVPLVVFIAAFALAGALLSLLMRRLGYDRISSTLTLAAGVGASLLAIDTISLYIVRQVPLVVAWRQASHVQPVYLAAILAGAAAAVLGRQALDGIAWNRMLAYMVALVGAADLLSAAVPPGPGQGWLLADLVSARAVPFANALIVPVGVLLLTTARGLSRRRHPAYVVAVAMLGASTMLQILKGGAYPRAMIAAVIGLLLLARRQDFKSPASPNTRARALTRLATMIVAAFAFGVATLAVNSAVADVPFSFGRDFVDTLRALIGLSPHISRYLPDGFATRFDRSIVLIVSAGVAWAAAIWLGSWRHSLHNEDDLGRDRANSIVRRSGDDTLAPFALRHDKSLFFFTADSPDNGFNETTGSDAVLVAYRVVRGLALMSGDPIGPAALRGPALDAFVEFAHHRGWQVAILGASGEQVNEYRAKGFHALRHGDEAVIDVAEFSIEGGQRRAIRQAASRAVRQGYSCDVMFAGDISAELQEELRAVEQSWLKEQPRKGFSMEMDDLFRLGGQDAIFVIGYSCDGRVAGFLHLGVCDAGKLLSLSSMPRLDDTPNGFNSWLVIETVKWAREHDFREVSLNFSPFAFLLADAAQRSLAERLEREILLRVKSALSLQLDNLYRFNRQFGPRSQARFVVYERRSDLPLVALAGMAAEGYLPFSERLRGDAARAPELEQALRPVVQPTEAEVPEPVPT